MKQYYCHVAPTDGVGFVAPDLTLAGWLEVRNWNKSLSTISLRLVRVRVICTIKFRSG